MQENYVNVRGSKKIKTFGIKLYSLETLKKGTSMPSMCERMTEQGPYPQSLLLCISQFQ